MPRKRRVVLVALAVAIIILGTSATSSRARDKPPMAGASSVPAPSASKELLDLFVDALSKEAPKVLGVAVNLPKNQNGQRRLGSPARASLIFEYDGKVQAPLEGWEVVDYLLANGYLHAVEGVGLVPTKAFDTLGPGITQANMEDLKHKYGLDKSTDKADGVTRTSDTGGVNRSGEGGGVLRSANPGGVLGADGRTGSGGSNGKKNESGVGKAAGEGQPSCTIQFEGVKLGSLASKESIEKCHGQVEAQRTACKGLFKGDPERQRQCDEACDREKQTKCPKSANLPNWDESPSNPDGR